MYSSSTLALKYLRYFLTASNSKGHGMHSPFVFELITQVFNDNKQYPAYDKVEALRKKLLGNHSVLQIKDLGAGSATSAGYQRTISAIAKNAAKPKKLGQLLYRIVQYYKPRNIVELGTSLGITTSYLALGNADAQLFTLEGSPEIARTASENLKSLSLTNVNVTEGNFDDTLGPLLQRLQSVDLVFIDGNHRYEPTIRYFNQLLPFTHNETVMIFDDIHWSEEMEQAWSAIRQHPSVRCTVDLFFIGIVFFRQEFKEKVDFSIKF